MKKLYRSSENKLLSGLIGGLGEYFDVDPTLLRLAILIVAIFTHPLTWVFIYCIGYLLVPEHSTDSKESEQEER